MKKVILITGASSGIGRESAILLAKNGYKVYGVARNIQKLQEIQKYGIKTFYMDLCDEESIKAGIEKILRESGRIDVLINNAGYGSYGTIEDVSIEEARRQFEVNLFGLARLTQLVLPIMREQRGGKIINISSMGGKITTLFGGWYHATKFALEGWSDCLRMEVRDFGIEVVVVEPGGIKSEWGEIASNQLEKTSGNGAYAKNVLKASKAMKEIYQGNTLSSTSLIAETILKAIQSKKPKTRYLVGKFAKLFVFLKRVLSDRAYDTLVLKAQGVTQ